MVHNGAIVCRGRNTMERSGDPTRHAEMNAIQEAARLLGRFKLPGCTLYVTLEPCPMCAGALLQARVGTLVYAAKNTLLGTLIEHARFMQLIANVLHASKLLQALNVHLCSLQK